jgi:hypothetical protein
MAGRGILTRCRSRSASARWASSCCLHWAAAALASRRAPASLSLLSCSAKNSTSHCTSPTELRRRRGRRGQALDWGTGATGQGDRATLGLGAGQQGARGVVRVRGGAGLGAESRLVGSVLGVGVVLGWGRSSLRLGRGHS